MPEHDEPRRVRGTVPKGDRRALTVRVPTKQWEIYEQQRVALGYKSLSDFAAALLAKYHGLPVPEYAQYADEAREAREAAEASGSVEVQPQLHLAS